MARPPRPTMDRDSAFFWEGVDKGELRIQRCAECAKLRHPPRPMCPACRSLDWSWTRAAGRGEVYSFVVHHHPPVYGFEVPFAIALVQLEEGTRIVGNVVGVDPAEVRIGMRVEVSFESVDGEWTLPQWRPRGGGDGTG